MEASIDEGFFRPLDHVAYKNKQSMTAWAERLWQRQLKGSFLDPRDEDGRRMFRAHISRVNEIRQLAKKLHRNNGQKMRSVTNKQNRLVGRKSRSAPVFQLRK